MTHKILRRLNDGPFDHYVRKRRKAGDKRDVGELFGEYIGAKEYKQVK